MQTSEAVQKHVQAIRDSPKMSALKDSLMGFCGTVDYHRDANGFGVLYTDGVSYMAEKAGAGWLVSDLGIVSRHKFSRIGFQLWVLRVPVGGRNAELTMREDTNAPILYRQYYDWTDFPSGTFVMYLRDGVLMLPSEY